MKKYFICVIVSLIVCSCSEMGEIDNIVITRDRLATLVADKESMEFEVDGGNQLLMITSNTSWSITCSQPWITTSPQSGIGNAVVYIEVEANSSNSAGARTGSVDISSDQKTISVYIVQKASTIPENGDNRPPSL